MTAVTVVDHPVLAHRLAQLRDGQTSSDVFRQLISEVSGLLAYEALRDLGTDLVTIDTPVADAVPVRHVTEAVLLVPILRAGLGMLDSILQLIPHACVGLIGLKREEKTLRAVFYHQSLPKNLGRFDVILIDPMLATGGSSVAAIDLLVGQGAKHIRMVNLVAAPEGIRTVQKKYPRVPIFTAAVDDKLNERGFIVPGLGDAGDRLFGT